MYICPMHPEIVNDTQGTCPKCHMKLVSREQNYHFETNQSYKLLIVIISVILATTFAFSIKDAQSGQFTFPATTSYFMIGFFLTFSTFKLLDLKGFAEGYSTYDLLAQHFFGYGYIYPFIELFLGLAMILFPYSKPLLWLEIVIMTFSGVGVAVKLAKHERFQCACLGTFLKVPLTKVTLIEDFGMAALALLLIIT